MEKTQVGDSITVGEHTFKALLPARRCGGCGAVSFGAGTLERFELRVAAELAKAGASSSEVLRFMRKALQLRAADLAELLDVAPETVSRWETGKLRAEHRTLALLGSLVEDKVEGRSSTMDRLRALREPKPLGRTVQLELNTTTS
jgi:DNA-binding transcriptional regulator YiaG